MKSIQERVNEMIVVDEDGDIILYAPPSGSSQGASVGVKICPNKPLGGHTLADGLKIVISRQLASERERYRKHYVSRLRGKKCQMKGKTKSPSRL